MENGHVEIPSAVVDTGIPAQTRRLYELGNQWVQDIYFDDDNTHEAVHVHYDHELDKKFTTSSLVGLGFSLMNVPFGVSTTLAIGLVCGSSAIIFWGWLIFGIFSLLISLSLAEIASKFPSSGGVYHFAWILAPDGYNVGLSWFVGWYSVVGNLLMFVSCAFGGAQFILSMFGLTQVTYKRDDLLILVVFVAIVAGSALVNLKMQKLLERFNRISIYWTIFTILFADVLIVVYGKQFHSIGDIVFDFDGSRSGYPFIITALIGVFQFPCLTYNGYGAIISMSEEVKNPEKNVPKGIILALVATVLTGFAFIIPLLSVLPSLDVFDENPDMFPIDIIFSVTTKSYVVSFGIVLMISGALVFASVGTLTTVSRMIFALGRDGLPYSDLWQEVDTTEDEEHVPRNALLLAVAVSIVIGCFSLVSSTAFSAFVGCSVMAMNIANGIPIFLSVLDRRRKIRGCYFKLRKFGYVVNVASCLIVVATILIVSLPPSLNVDIQSMNYSFAVFFLATLLITIGYFVWGRAHFRGPQLEETSTQGEDMSFPKRQVL